MTAQGAELKTVDADKAQERLPELWQKAATGNVVYLARRPGAVMLITPDVAPKTSEGETVLTLLLVAFNAVSHDAMSRAVEALADRPRTQRRALLRTLRRWLWREPDTADPYEAWAEMRLLVEKSQWAEELLEATRESIEQKIAQTHEDAEDYAAYDNWVRRGRPRGVPLAEAKRALGL